MHRPSIFLLLLGTAITTTAMASPREDALSGIARCSAIADDRVFLDCLYGAAQPLRAQLGLTPAAPGQIRLVPPAASAMVAPPPRLAAPAAMPAPAPIAAPATARRSMAANGAMTKGWLETYSFDGKGRFTIMLSNGQIWLQDAADTNRAHWTGRGSDYAVTLISDTSGGAQMRMLGDPNIYVVTRRN